MGVRRKTFEQAVDRRHARRLPLAFHKALFQTTEQPPQKQDPQRPSRSARIRLHAASFTRSSRADAVAKQVELGEPGDVVGALHAGRARPWSRERRPRCRWRPSNIADSAARSGASARGQGARASPSPPARSAASPSGRTLFRFTGMSRHTPPQLAFSSVRR